MQFTYKGKNVEIACAAGDTVKLYEVPESYSADGFYAAVWRYGDVEPAPACRGDAAFLLAHVTVQEDGDKLTAFGYMAEGVSYA